MKKQAKSAGATNIVNIRYVALSATVPNPEDIAVWSVFSLQIAFYASAHAQ